MKIQFQSNNITVFESALFKTTATVIDLPNMVLVIDPNWLPQEVYAIREYVSGIRKQKALYLFFTHSDYDHIIGYKAFSDAKTIASKSFVDNSNKEKNINQILDFDDEYYIERDYPIEYPAIDIVIEEVMQEVNIEGSKLDFHQAPGHNRDGLILHLKEQEALIVGDYLSDVEFPYVYHSSDEYLNTLNTLENIIQKNDIRILISGHGNIAVDKVEVQKRIDDSRSYIHALKTGKIDTEALWERYQFKRHMQQYHEANIKLIENEQAKINSRRL